MLLDFGQEAQIRLRSDSCAVIGIAFKRGLGRVRHLEVQELWIQDHALRKKVERLKVAGIDNISDILTKGLAWDAISAIVNTMRFHFVEGRSDKEPLMDNGVSAFSVGQQARAQTAKRMQCRGSTTD